MDSSDVAFWCREKALANRRRAFNRQRIEQPPIPGTPLLDELKGSLRARMLAEQHPERVWCCSRCNVLAPADSFQRAQLSALGWDAVRELCGDCQVTIIEFSEN